MPEINPALIKRGVSMFGLVALIALVGFALKPKAYEMAT